MHNCRGPIPDKGRVDRLEGVKNLQPPVSLLIAVDFPLATKDMCITVDKPNHDATVIG